MEIKNSSNQIIGNIEIIEDKIYINNFSKPLLVIEDKNLINKILNKDYSATIVLFNEYYLIIAEIAALYKVCYATMAKKLKQLGLDTTSKVAAGILLMDRFSQKKDESI